MALETPDKLISDNVNKVDTSKLFELIKKKQDQTPLTPSKGPGTNYVQSVLPGLAAVANVSMSNPRNLENLDVICDSSPEKLPDLNIRGVTKSKTICPKKRLSTIYEKPKKRGRPTKKKN